MTRRWAAGRQLVDVARSAKLSTSSNAGDAPIISGEKAAAATLDKRGERADVIGARRRARPDAASRVDDQEAIRFTARRAEFLLVYLAEQLALIEFDGAFQIAADLRPGDVQHLDLEPAGKFRAVHQPRNTTPRAFQLAHAVVVQDGIDLLGEHGVDRGDVAVERIAQRLFIDGNRAPRSGPNHRRSHARGGIEEVADRIGQREVPAAGKVPDSIASRPLPGR